MNAVVDADPDERHDRKDGKQIQLDAGQREDAGVQTSPITVGSSAKIDRRQSRKAAEINSTTTRCR